MSVLDIVDATVKLSRFFMFSINLDFNFVLLQIYKFFILFEGRKFKVYRGMGSLGAMELGSKDRYFQDVEDDVKKLVPEGIEGRVPFKGSVSEVMVQYLGGLRASMGYCGAPDIKTMQKAKMVRITGSGILESHPHNITITKESPNYSKKG
jgi:IMP dehydrogenase